MSKRPPISPSLPRRFRHITLADYEPKRGDEVARDMVEQYIADLKSNYDEGVGLLLVGAPGRGKTMMACAIANAALEEKFSVYFMKLSSYHQMYLRMFDLKDAWNRTEDPDAYDEWREILNRLDVIRKEVDFVIIDEVGKEHKTSTRYAQDGFDFLLRDRYDRGLPTIMTSNTPLADWAVKYSESMASFVHEACVIVPVMGDDFRKG